MQEDYLVRLFPELNKHFILIKTIRTLINKNNNFQARKGNTILYVAVRKNC